VTAEQSLQRSVFPAGACPDRLLRLLLAQDGSTTRICEAILGGIELAVHRQELIEDPPEEAAEVLGAGALLERFTSLHRNGRVAMDNLVLTRPDSLAVGFRGALLDGRVPVGRLLSGSLLRRRSVDSPRLLARLLTRLAAAGCGPVDLRGSRLYVVEGEDGLVLLIAETYRAALAEDFCGGSSL
jgi:chorismate-pyruvate lyase